MLPSHPLHFCPLLSNRYPEAGNLLLEPVQRFLCTQQNQKQQIVISTLIRSHPLDGWADALTTPYLCSSRLGPACCLSPGVEEPVLEVRIVHQPQLVHVFLLPRDLPAPHDRRLLQISCLRPLRLWWPPCRRQLPSRRR